MRILHTNAGYSPFIGGAETYLQAMSERLARDGHQVTVATTDATGVQSFWDPRQSRVPLLRATINDVRVVRSPVRYLPFSPWSFYILRRLATEIGRWPTEARPILDRMVPYMPAIPAMESTLEDLKPGFDLVHGVNISLEWPLIAGQRYAQRHGLPFIATPFLHVGEWQVERFYTMPHQLLALRTAARVLVQTSIEERELVRLGVPRARIVRLGMGVDLEQVKGGDAERFRKQHGIDGPVVTFMGAVTDDKGAVHLVQAMQRLWERGSRAVLVLAGPPVTPSNFERVYGTLPELHRQQVRRMGPVHGQLKQDMLAATDLFALPSRIDSFGIVYLEAWAYRAPVIGCHAGGVPDVIDDGQDGLLVGYGDISALSWTIETLLSNPDRLRSMGKLGRAKVEACYTWDRIYQVFLGICQAVLAERSADGEVREPRLCT